MLVVDLPHIVRMVEKVLPRHADPPAYGFANWSDPSYINSSCNLQILTDAYPS